MALLKTRATLAAARTLAAEPVGVPTLLARLAEEHVPAARAALLDILLAQGGPMVIEGLLVMLASNSGGPRHDVVTALREVPAQTAAHLERRLRDPDPELRLFTVNLLESLHHPQQLHWLIEVVRQDSNLDVCAAAVDLLGEVGDHRAMEALRAVKLRFPEAKFLHFAVDVALGQID